MTSRQFLFNTFFLGITWLELGAGYAIWMEFLKSNIFIIIYLLYSLEKAFKNKVKKYKTNKPAEILNKTINGKRIGFIPMKKNLENDPIDFKQKHRPCLLFFAWKSFLCCFAKICIH